jgi:hypothetical protein
MRIHRLNNIVHRDLGYFFAGMTILFALSGLALNHADHWNPNFIIKRKELTLDIPSDVDVSSRQWASQVLESLGEQTHYLSHDQPSPLKAKIYLDDGSVFVDLTKGKAVYESVKRRPLFYRINCLHINPDQAWLVFSDMFAVALIIVTVTGLFVLRGRKGIKGRGAILTIAGLLIPLVFFFLI